MHPEAASDASGNPHELHQSIQSATQTSSQPLPKYLIAVLLISAAVIRIYMFFTIRYTADDAFITFRYAENLASGVGFVYNAGEKVLGTSTMLEGLIIALFVKIGISSISAAFIISLTADCFIGWVLLQIFSHAPGPSRWVPAFLFLFGPETLQWSLSGMETQVSIAWLFAAILLSSQEKWTAAFLSGSFAVWTRVDGIAVLAGLTVCYFLQKRKLPLKPLLIAFVALIPMILFGFLMYGSPIPNSAAAKWALAGKSEGNAIYEILFRGFLHLNTVGIPFLVLALLGSWNVWRNHRYLLLIPIWAAGYAISYTAAAGPMHPWYYAPFYAAYLPLIWLGLLYLLKKRQMLIHAAALISIPIVLCISYYRALDLQSQQDHYETINRAAGEWVNENTPPHSVLAIKDIGYLGYYSRRYILDLAGLVSPQCIDFRARGDFLGPIRAFHPDYFAFSGGQARSLNLKNSDLMQHYVPAKTIQSRYGSYIIYKRK
jgi:arabinofuranosyltransferase